MVKEPNIQLLKTTLLRLLAGKCFFVDLGMLIVSLCVYHNFPNLGRFIAASILQLENVRVIGGF